MPIVTVPEALRRKLGDDGSEALIELLKAVQEEMNEKIEGLRVEANEKIDGLRVEMHREMGKMKADIIRWMFVFNRRC